jgi:hypothetical protein
VREHRVDVSVHICERVSDLVRDTGSESTHHRELLGLHAQLHASDQRLGRLGPRTLALVAATRRVRARQRTARARAVVGYANVGAFALMMVALVAVAGCGWGGEMQAASLPALVVGSVVSGVASLTGSASVR